MLPLSLFRNRNFSVGNVATLAVYAGLSVATFLIVLFLQQVSGYSALNAGLSLLPVTIIMFLLSPRFGALAGKHGPRFFMGIGPLIAGIGFLLIGRLPVDFNYWTQLLPGIVIFGLGLSVTVAPLTAAILGDVPKSEAGIASAVNNAVARIAGLLAVAAVGAVVALQFGHTLDKVCSTASPAALAEGQAGHPGHHAPETVPARRQLQGSPGYRFGGGFPYRRRRDGRPGDGWRYHLAGWHKESGKSEKIVTDFAMPEVR